MIEKKYESMHCLTIKRIIMNIILLNLLVILIIVISLSTLIAQSIPEDSLYPGQTFHWYNQIIFKSS